MTSVASVNTDHDAIVIGGGVGGLVAAAYLARAGARVLLLEARDTLGGRAEAIMVGDRFRASLADTLYGLDGRVARELKLFKRGLALAERDMKLVALRPGGGHIVVSRRGLKAQNGIVAFPGSDLAAYRQFRRETLAFARRLRPLWQAEPIELAAHPQVPSFDSIVIRLRLSAAETDRLIELQRFSASAYLDRWFASDALKAALSFDAGVDGVSPHEAGSALALVWRLAQESYGVQAAVSQPKGGSASLVIALANANKHFGVELRTGCRVASIIVENGRAAGVVLESGEAYGAGAVISNLDFRHTLLELLPPAAIGFGAAASVPNSGRVASAKLILGLNGLPPVAGLEQQDLRSRLIVADRPEVGRGGQGGGAGWRIGGEARHGSHHPDHCRFRTRCPGPTCDVGLGALHARFSNGRLDHLPRGVGESRAGDTRSVCTGLEGPGCCERGADTGRSRSPLRTERRRWSFSAHPVAIDLRNACAHGAGGTLSLRQ